MQSNMIFQERSAIQNWTNFIWNEIGFTLQFPHGAYHQKFISPDQTSLSKGATRLRLLCEKSHNNCAYPKMHIDSARYRFYAGLISSLYQLSRARLSGGGRFTKKSESIGGAVCASTNYSKFSSGRRLQLLNGTQPQASALEESVPNRDFWTITSFPFLEVRNRKLALFISNLKKNFSELGSTCKALLYEHLHSSDS